MNNDTRDRLETLTAVDRALARECLVLSERPKMLWQQVHNRLASNDSLRGTLGLDRLAASHSRSGPWLKLRTPLSESNTLKRTLAIHGEWVYDCAFSPDGTRVASVGRDGALRILGTRQVREFRVLKGSGAPVYSCAFSFDGRFVATVAGDNPTTGSVDQEALEARLAKLREQLAGMPADPDLDPDAYIEHLREQIGNVPINYGWKPGSKVTIWDAVNGEVLHVLEGHEGPIRDHSFSPDGQFIVSAGDDRIIRTWDAHRGTLVKTIELARDAWACCVSPNGLQLATVEGDPQYSDRPGSTLILVNLASGETVHRLVGHEQGITSCAFSPNGRLVLTASLDRTLRLWDTIQGTQVTTIATDDEVRACALSPDGRRVLSGSKNGDLCLWDIETGARLARFQGHSSPIVSCAFSPDGTEVVSGSIDRTVKLWNAIEDSHSGTARGHEGRVCAISFSRDGRSVASAGEDGTVRTWDAESGLADRVLVGHGHAVQACEFSFDGRYLLSADERGGVKQWDLGNGVEHASQKVLTSNSPMRTSVFSPDSRAVVFVVENTAHVAVAAVDSRWSEGGRFATLSTRAIACGYSPDGRRLVTVGHDGLKVWSALPSAPGVSSTGETELQRLDNPVRDYGACAFSPDGRSILSSQNGHALALWDTESGACVRTFVVGRPSIERDAIQACAFSPDGQFFAEGGWDRTLRIWHTESGATLGELPVAGGVECVAFDPAHPVLACADWGGNVYVLDLCGIEYGPLAVTPYEEGKSLAIRCPVCLTAFKVDRADLGALLDCRERHCAGRMRVNKSVMASFELTRMNGRVFGLPA